jgi:ElaB/YqjD/DUF883 family membrane-anchored ribosome-binding protein
MKNRLPEYVKVHNGRHAGEEQVADAASTVERNVKDIGRVVANYVQHHPKLAVGALFSVGVLVGWLVKRR